MKWGPNSCNLLCISYSVERSKSHNRFKVVLTWPNITSWIMWRLLPFRTRWPVFKNFCGTHTWRSCTKILKTSIRKAWQTKNRFHVTRFMFTQLANGNGMKFDEFGSLYEILWNYTTPPSFSVGRKNGNHFIMPMFYLYLLVYWVYWGDAMFLLCWIHGAYLCRPSDRKSIGRYSFILVDSDIWEVIHATYLKRITDPHLLQFGWYLLLCASRENYAQAQTRRIWPCFFKLTSCFVSTFWNMSSCWQRG